MNTTIYVPSIPLLISRHRSESQLLHVYFLKVFSFLWTMEGQSLSEMIMWRSGPLKTPRRTCHAEPFVHYITHWLPFRYSDQLSSPHQGAYQHGTSEPSLGSGQHWDETSTETSRIFPVSSVLVKQCFVTCTVSGPQNCSVFTLNP